MSYTTVFAIGHDGQLREALRQSNSHHFCALIWDNLWRRYVAKPDDPPWINWLTGDHEKLWALETDARLGSMERLALRATFDRVWVPLEEIALVDEAMFQSGGWICGMASLRFDHDVRGICFQGTSCARDLWWVNDGERLLNIDRDTLCADGEPHWCITDTLSAS